MPNDAANGKGGGLPRGAYTKIARRLRPKVSVSHVRQVALGQRKSPRVERAIERYRASLDESKAA